MDSCSNLLNCKTSLVNGHILQYSALVAQLNSIFDLRLQPTGYQEDKNCQCASIREPEASIFNTR